METIKIRGPHMFVRAMVTQLTESGVLDTGRMDRLKSTMETALVTMKSLIKDKTELQRQLEVTRAQSAFRLEMLNRACQILAIYGVLDELEDIEDEQEVEDFPE